MTSVQSRPLDDLDRYDLWFVAERIADEGRLPEDSIAGANVKTTTCALQGRKGSAALAA